MTRPRSHGGAASHPGARVPRAGRLSARLRERGRRGREGLLCSGGAERARARGLVPPRAPCARHLPATLPGRGVRASRGGGRAQAVTSSARRRLRCRSEKDAGSEAPGGSTAPAPLGGGTSRRGAGSVPRAPVALRAEAGSARRASGRSPRAPAPVRPLGCRSPSRRPLRPPAWPPRAPGASGATRGAEGQGARGAHSGAGP